MRMLACPLFRWLNVVRFGLRPDRQHEAKFPAARAHHLNGPREVRALLAVHPSMRFVRVIIRNSLKIHMKSYTSGRSRPGRGRSRRRGGDGQRRRSDTKAAPQKKGFWSRIVDFFAAPEKAEQRNGSHSRQQARTPHKPEPIEVTSPRLYVGNLSFDLSTAVSHPHIHKNRLKK